ncbi:FAD dependent oxidoreductase [Natrialba chahannaoensis JCM 10990]|uniref:FAD dependent oxidoreductase n=1 Tax=Natrialba chahannaoensis JCM 10990 TaxID=1227492 RepID=M0AFV3_9EURY|nr:FAD-dependent oxidoreductase [Natrialba chahannaoensis]ELY97271.1 FAD dependent oxidoreductase [Natrialba chahannaoensis JCM 10990]
MSTDADVIIVGGGCIGATIARELAADHNVLLLERDQIAGETTGHSSGIIQPQYQFPHLPKAGRLSFRFFESLDGHRNYEYTARELVNLHGPEKTEQVQRYTELVSRNGGYDTTWLSAAEIDERYPGVFNVGEESPIAGGMVYGRMGWVDPYTYTTTVSQDATDRGATIETGVEVTGLLVEAGNVVGVTTETGDYRAPEVVVAAGRWSRELVADHIAIPIQPQRFWHINLESETDLSQRVSDEYPQWYMDLDFGDGLPADLGLEGFMATFWRPEHTGELHVAGIEGLLGENPSVKTTVDEEFHLLLAERIADILDEFDEGRVTNDGCCPTGDAMSPDWLPIIDSPADGPAGLTIATGFSGLGLSASPIAAAAVRQLISGHGAPFSLASLSLDRFDDRSAEFAEPPFDVFDTSVFEE